MTDYLIYATGRSIHGLYVDPTVKSRPFTPVTSVPRIQTFAVNYEDKTLIVVSGNRLKKVAFNNGEVTDLLTAANASGLSQFQPFEVNCIFVPFNEWRPVFGEKYVATCQRWNRVTGHQVTGSAILAGSGHGSVCQTRCLIRF